METGIKLYTPVEMYYKGEYIEGAMFGNDAHQIVFYDDLKEDSIVFWQRERSNKDEEWKEWSKPYTIKLH